MLEGHRRGEVSPGESMNETVSEERFRALYDLHHRAVLAYFLRRTDSDSAYEGTEDVYLVAWRKLEVIPDGDDALAWLYGVARRVLLNQRRSSARRVRLTHRLRGVQPPTPDEVEPQVIRHFEQQEVISAMAGLSTSDQEVIRLAYWEDLPHAQISDILGCSVGAVDVRLHRAVRRLEKGLGAAGHRWGGSPVLFPGDEQL